MRPATCPTGRGYLESRIAVDDGYIWPFDRPQMVSEGAITERMIEDIGALVNDGGESAVVTLDDLTRQGWLPEQTRRFGARAFALYEAAHRKPRRTTGNRSTVRKPGFEEVAACLAILAVPVAIGARCLLTGVV